MAQYEQDWPVETSAYRSYLTSEGSCPPNRGWRLRSKQRPMMLGQMPRSMLPLVSTCLM